MMTLFLLSVLYIDKFKQIKEDKVIIILELC